MSVLLEKIAFNATNRAPSGVGRCRGVRGLWLKFDERGLTRSFCRCDLALPFRVAKQILPRGDSDGAWICWPTASAGIEREVAAFFAGDSKWLAGCGTLIEPVSLFRFVIVWESTRGRTASGRPCWRIHFQSSRPLAASCIHAFSRMTKLLLSLLALTLTALAQTKPADPDANAPAASPEQDRVQKQFPPAGKPECQTDSAL